MRIKSPATWLFIQQFDQDNNKEKIKAPPDLAHCVGIPLAKATGSDAESVIMCHDIITQTCLYILQMPSFGCHANGNVNTWVINGKGFHVMMVPRTRYRPGIETVSDINDHFVSMVPSKWQHNLYTNYWTTLDIFEHISTR